MWSAQLIDFEKPHSWISSGGLGTMGFGLPAAIGASVGSQRDFKGRKPVWLIAGDGSFQMTSEELTTAFLDHAPVKIAIINNSVYGMVRQWQTLFFEQHYSQTNLADGDSKEGGEFFDVPDFVKLAEAYGCVGLRAFTEDEAIDAINKANEINDRPVLMTSACGRTPWCGRWWQPARPTTRSRIVRARSRCCTRASTMVTRRDGTVVKE